MIKKKVLFIAGFCFICELAAFAGGGADESSGGMADKNVNFSNLCPADQKQYGIIQPHPVR